MGDRLGIPGVVGILHALLHWYEWACGATVARLTPDQKVACSNHVGLSFFFLFFDEITMAFFMERNIHGKVQEKRRRPWVGSNHQPFG